MRLRSLRLLLALFGLLLGGLFGGLVGSDEPHDDEIWVLHTFYGIVLGALAGLVMFGLFGWLVLRKNVEE